MALARCAFDATDEAGNLLSNVQVEVRRESSGKLVQCYSDRNGTVSLGNPFEVADGRVAFHVAGGAYRIQLTAGGYTRERRYVGIGTAQESDLEGLNLVGYSFVWSTVTTSPPDLNEIRANNADLSAATALYIADDTIGGTDISALLLALAPAASNTKNRIILADPITGLTATFDVDGVTDGSGFVTLAVSGHVGETELEAGQTKIVFDRAGGRGVDGDGIITAGDGILVDYTDPDEPIVEADFATEAEAEAGVAEDKVMSPLRTAQAIVAQATGYPDSARRNAALSYGRIAKLMGGLWRGLDTVAFGFSVSGEADAGSANGAVDTGGKAWKPDGTTTNVTIDAQDSAAAISNITVWSRATAVLNNVAIYSIGVYSTAAKAFTMKIGLRNSAGNITTVVNQAFSHPGGGWADCVLTSSYTVPASGNYYVGAYTNVGTPDVKTSTLRSFQGGNITGTSGGYTEDTGQAYPLRYGHTSVASNSTLITAYQTADGARTKARAIVEIDPIDAITLNTDWTIELTCNGGTNWHAATETNIGTGQAGRTVIETDEVTCTSGTSFAARIKNLNNKMVHVHQVTLQAAA